MTESLTTYPESHPYPPAIGNLAVRAETEPTVGDVTHRIDIVEGVRYDVGSQPLSEVASGETQQHLQGVVRIDGRLVGLVRITDKSQQQAFGLVEIRQTTPQYD